jgi:hypothetical protein
MARKLKKQYAVAHASYAITKDDLYPTIADALVHPVKVKSRGGLYETRYDAKVAANPEAYHIKWCVMWDGKTLSTATFTRIGN